MLSYPYFDKNIYDAYTYGNSYEQRFKKKKKEMDIAIYGQVRSGAVYKLLMFMLISIL